MLRHRSLRISLLVALVPLAAAGCASTMNEKLTEVDSQLDQVRQSSAAFDPQARLVLIDAYSDLGQARRTWYNTRNYGVSMHLADLAERKADVARRVAELGREPAEETARARMNLRYVPSDRGAAPLAAHRTLRGLEVQIPGSSFRGGELVLTGAAARSVNGLAAALRRAPSQTVTIETYGDGPTGEASARQAVLRAEAVRQELLRSGVPPDQIVIRGLAVAWPGGEAPRATLIVTPVAGNA